jgi:metal-sulfur cluster biosynthetic enzyme
MEWSEANGAANTAARFLGSAAGSPGLETDSQLVARVSAALGSVMDPELGIDIVNLGLVQRIGVEQGRVSVELTMTTPACPPGESVVDQAKQRIVALEGVRAADVRLVWEPVWTPERMSSTARAALGWVRFVKAWQSTACAE